MKFTFEINLQEYDIYDNKDFKDAIINAAKESIVAEMFSNNFDGTAHAEVRDYTRKFCKEHEQEIFDAVVKNIVENIEKKKAIKELAPSTKDIQMINKENERYFMELIDKAIAKRFK